MVNNEKKSKAFTLACVWFLALDLIWMGLEMLLYGEVQHRWVDDIIGIPILYSFYLNGLYYLERKYGR